MLTYNLHRNLPIGVVVLVVLSIFLKLKGVENANRRLSLKKKLESMDPLGCFVFIGAVCCLLLALQWGGQSKPWSSSTVIGLIVGFAALFGLFGYLQWRRQDRALIPTRVLRQRSIFTSAMVLFFLGASTYLVSMPLVPPGKLMNKPNLQNVFFLPFYFQAVRGVGPIASGVDFIPLLLSQMVALIAVGAIVKQWGYYVGNSYSGTRNY